MRIGVTEIFLAAVLALGTGCTSRYYVPKFGGHFPNDAEAAQNGRVGLGPSTSVMDLRIKPKTRKPKKCNEEQAKAPEAHNCVVDEEGKPEEYKPEEYKPSP